MPTKQKPGSIVSLSKDRSFLISLSGVIVILIISMVVVERLGGPTKLAELVGRAGAWAPVAFILAKALTYVIAPLSGTPVKIIAGTLFGFFPGLIYATLGDLLGASINFWIARVFGRKAVYKLFSKKSVQKIDGYIAHIETWKTLLVARVALSSFYDFISYAVGLSKMRYKTFFLVTLIGGIPTSALAVGLGTTLTANTGLFVALLGGGLVLVVILSWVSGKVTRLKRR